MFRAIYVWLRHKLGIQTGNIVSWRENDTVCIAFECDCCKKIDEKTIVRLVMDNQTEQYVEEKD